MKSSNYIKVILWFLFINVMVCGCKIRKDKSTIVRVLEQTEAQVQSKNSWTRAQAVDSTARYWSYTSDSSFWFHPDIGLWAQSGRLEYIERNTAQTMETHWWSSNDSTGAAYSDEVNNTRLNHTKSVWISWYWLFAILPIAIGGYYFFRKRSKKDQ